MTLVSRGCGALKNIKKNIEKKEEKAEVNPSTATYSNIKILSLNQVSLHHEQTLYGHGSDCTNVLSP